jgi:hypothetical protein
MSLIPHLSFVNARLINNLALSREVEGIASNLSMLELFNQLNNSL